jgi:hypothetical protein
MNRVSNLLNNQKGSVIVLLAIVMTGLLAGTAVVTDIGVNYVIQSRLSIAADAAALAAGTKLGEGYDSIKQAALRNAEKNGLAAENVIVEIDENGGGVTVRAQAPMQLYFARIFGAEGGLMEQRARVAKTRPTAFFDIFPLGMDESLNLAYNTRVNLFGSDLLGDSSKRGALSFYDEDGKLMTGANTLREFLKNGYPGLVEVDDLIYAKPGVNNGPVSEGVDYRINLAPNSTLENLANDCPRILILPVYRQLPGDFVQVVDFAAFWIESRVGQGNNLQVWGHFIKPHMNPAASVEGESPYGMTATRLVQ